jgi:hypothetical protein
MQVGNVVSAVEVIVNVDLPVAVNVISSTIEVVELTDAQRSNTFR